MIKYRITTDSPESEEYKHILIDGNHTGMYINNYGNITGNVYRNDGNELFIQGSWKRGASLSRRRLVACIFTPIPKKLQFYDQLELYTTFIDRNSDNLYFYKNIKWMDSTISDVIERANTPYKSEDAILVHQICRTLEEDPSVKYAELARQLGIQPAMITRIICGRAWTYISKNYTLPHKRELTPDDTVEKVCKMLESGLWTSKEIMQTCNITRGVYGSIRKRKVHLDIVSKYDF